jgi:hypothetical protein
MANLRQAFQTARNWFQGKKTIIGGVALIAAGVAGVVTGKMTVLDGFTVAGFGFSICGWSAKVNRHQSEMLTALQAVATAGVDLRLGNKAGALAAMQPVIGEAIQATVPALTVSVSGQSAGAVLRAVSALTTSPLGGVPLATPLSTAEIAEVVNRSSAQAPSGVGR